MNSQSDPDDVRSMASAIEAEFRALPALNTPNMRAVTRRYSHKLERESAGFVLALARSLWHDYGHRWVAYELIAAHHSAYQSLGEAELEGWGQGIGSWGAVDSFARTLSGPVWRDGQVSDELIHKWAGSPDLWWRRAALVSTVALNVRSQGGQGDVPRTLAVCRLLVADHEDMVAKAMSWALRELVVHDPQAVQAFLAEHDAVLAAIVKREVGHKLRTGLKNPHRAGKENQKREH